VNPKEILHHVTELYLGCRSYSDCGMVEFEDLDKTEQQLQFRTEFIRPDYLKFEWQDYGPRRGLSEQFSLLWSDENKTILRRNRGTIENEPSLQLAIAGATGCSAGAACIVPTLLMTEIGADFRQLLQLSDIQLQGNEIIEGKDCYVLHGSSKANYNHILWISTHDFSLRRIHTESYSTAKESKEAYDALMENKEFAAILVQQGLSSPEDGKYSDRQFVTTYTYRDVSFDLPIARMPQPVG
jgi:hypothetical protein